MLINDMLSSILASAGSNEDITQRLREAMENYYARCSTETPNMGPGKTGGLNQAIKSVKKLMNDFELRNRTPDIIPVQSVEGGFVS
jgi:hypothetical protein